MKVYVVLKSWNDILYKLEAWSRNYFIASNYYNNFLKSDPDAMFKEIEVRSISELSIKLKIEYDSDISDILSTLLKSKLSRNDNIYVIYKSEVSEYFEYRTLDNELKTNVTKLLSHISLEMSQLMKYVFEDMKVLLYLIYANVLNVTELDMVYIWYLVINGSNKSIPAIVSNGNIIKKNSVFTIVT